ncbi:hypothetical protein [Nocardia miyunensis]|uniref:hypothetical protein n=1 Tax=Nocardia miyunensis TaxID=282684 RepID=UPI00082CA97E|nr:hypothetical protein [Nocardia miyunensis]
MHDDRGRIFRQAWIDGVNTHYPGEPKASYITPWDDTPEWEKSSATAVFDQVRAFIEAGAANTATLSRDQKSRFVAVCWIVQIYRHIPNPKPGYVADWEQLPEWQQKTDADIFEAIERSLLKSSAD